MDITVADGIYEYKLFNKRDNYTYFIVHMPELGGNRPQAKQFDDESKRKKKQGNISLFITYLLFQLMRL